MPSACFSMVCQIIALSSSHFSGGFYHVGIRSYHTYHDLKEPRSSTSVMAWALLFSYSALTPTVCSSQVPLSTHLHINPAQERQCHDIGKQERKSPEYFFSKVTLRHTGYTFFMAPSPTQQAFPTHDFHQALGSVITNSSLCSLD